MTDINPERFVREGDGCTCGALYSYGGHIEPGQYDPDCSRHGFSLPLHRTEAGYPNCATCDGGGCLDCTDSAYE